MSVCVLHSLPARLPGLPVSRYLCTRRLHAGLLEAARSHGERTALVDPSGRHTYRQLLARAAALAGRLRRAAPEPGSRVAVLAPPGHQFVSAQWAVWMAGHVAVPLCGAHPTSQHRYYLHDSQSAAVVGTEETAEQLETAVADSRLPLLLADGETTAEGEGGARGEGEEVGSREDSQPAVILYTSGTTGPPKGVVLTHGNLLSQTRDMVSAWQWQPSDVILHTLPLHHTHGLINALACPLYVGAKCVMLPSFDAEKVWYHLLDTVSDPAEQVNVFTAVPTIYAKLLEHYDNKSRNNFAYQSFVKDVCKSKIRVMISGSAALARPILDRWEVATGHRLLERYGMTETGMVLTNPLHGHRVPGAVGRPFPSVSVRVARFEPGVSGYTTLSEADGSGACTVTPGCEDQEGELLVRGPSLFSGYWRRPEVTAREFTADGWFRTGDTARLSDGVFSILGRTSVDIIKTGGFKISALDVERRLLEHPEVQDVAVVGLPDLTWGQKVAAVVVSSADLDLAGLKQWCGDQLPPYAAPTVLKVLPQMPRNAMGKVNKKQLVKDLFPEPGTAPAAGA
ncbi:malonate--CoA ligase ACSF3, mitochondrial-like isoform X1 [Amphibalanus amphitrite]|uniref:malonate--CoA ligase ACSF3, mitochondrial-like isoform X1 n=1 Tax=Amphibalanus amphitrite TaxID=1232801 RepID=UPI001C91B67F|nr:malonate--CoA ligase ACSF3, mitochondrial-like isoform X1 [Amphibalanus amphitrite]